MNQITQGLGTVIKCFDSFPLRVESHPSILSKPQSLTVNWLGSASEGWAMECFVLRKDSIYGSCCYSFQRCSPHHSLFGGAIVPPQGILSVRNSLCHSQLTNLRRQLPSLCVVWEAPGECVRGKNGFPEESHNVPVLSERKGPQGASVLQLEKKGLRV